MGYTRLQQILKEADGGDKKPFRTFSENFKDLMKKSEVEGCELNQPNTLGKISVLVGDHHGYKLVSMKKMIENAYDILDEKIAGKLDAVDEMIRSAKEMEKQAFSKDQLTLKKEDASAQNGISRSQKIYQKAYVAKRDAEREIRNDAIEFIGNILEKHQMVFQNDKGEVGLLAYHDGKLTGMKADEVEKEMTAPEDIGFFKKFILAVKEFFKSEKTEEDLKFMTQQNAYELEKAKRKALGIKNPEKKAKEVAAKKPAEKSGEKTEPKKDAPKKTPGKGM